ncbi:MAG: phosphotransferase, partial [Steroidobacteraceae bacterium]|nr:phosphotransferase [Steroidobacteraceae bacterium]
ELLDELQWVAALHAEDLPVSEWLPTRSGACGCIVQAPEGDRFACLYRWIPGRTLAAPLTPLDAHAAGELAARLHLAVAQLPPHARQHSLAAKLERTAAALDAALESAAERALLAAARAQLRELPALERSLPQGSLHGDLHFGNLRRGDDARLYLLDFDDCGRGALAIELVAFDWRCDCEGLPPELKRRFRGGYESLRPLSAAEQSALPVLALARAVYLAGVLARDRDILGRVPGFERPWAHYVGLIERCLAEL